MRNLSGRLVISLSMRWILPEVGLAIQPIKLKRVVFPEPLGPFNTVILPESICRLIPSMAVNSFGFPMLKTFLMFTSSIIFIYRMTESGSIVAALHEGITVATV